MKTRAGSNGSSAAKGLDLVQILLPNDDIDGCSLRRSGRAQRYVPSESTRSPQLPFSHYTHQYGVSESTLRRSANAWFLPSSHASCRLIGPQSVLKRLGWAQDKVEQDWSTIIFTDEMSIELGLLRRSYTNRAAGEPMNPGHSQLRFRSGRRF